MRVPPSIERLKRLISQCPSSKTFPLLPSTFRVNQRKANLSLWNVKVDQKELVKALYSKKVEWQTKVGIVSKQVSELTGYGGIEKLKVEVEEKEKILSELRALSSQSKSEHEIAVAKRATSHAEVNDLLQRKTVQGWGEGDVERFTALVKRDHENELEEKRTKEEMEKRDLDTDKAFSNLMQAILNRYHEEQVWSDKIRTISSYGSIGITALNILLFVAAILIVEPWKRRKMVDRFEERLEERSKVARENLRQDFEIALAKSEITESRVEELLETIVSRLMENPQQLSLSIDKDRKSEQRIEEIESKELKGVREIPLQVPFLSSGSLEEATDAATLPGTDVPIAQGLEEPIPTICEEEEKVMDEEEAEVMQVIMKERRNFLLGAAATLSAVAIITMVEWSVGH